MGCGGCEARGRVDVEVVLADDEQRSGSQPQTATAPGRTRPCEQRARGNRFIAVPSTSSNRYPPTRVGGREDRGRPRAAADGHAGRRRARGLGREQVVLDDRAERRKLRLAAGMAGDEADDVDQREEGGILSRDLDRDAAAERETRDGNGPDVPGRAQSSDGGVGVGDQTIGLDQVAGHALAVAVLRGS